MPTWNLRTSLRQSLQAASLKLPAELSALGPGSRWFVTPSVETIESDSDIFTSGNHRTDRITRNITTLGTDVGYRLGNTGVARLGVGRRWFKSAPAISSRLEGTARDTGNYGRVGLTVDSLDDANFPRSGYGFSAVADATRYSTSDVTVRTLARNRRAVPGDLRPADAARTRGRRILARRQGRLWPGWIVQSRRNAGGRCHGIAGGGIRRCRVLPARRAATRDRPRALHRNVARSGEHVGAPLGYALLGPAQGRIAVPRASIRRSVRCTSAMVIPSAAIRRCICSWDGRPITTEASANRSFKCSEMRTQMNHTGAFQMQPLKLLTMLALILTAALLPVRLLAQSRESSRLPTPFVEDGRSVTLEAIIYKPGGRPPFPVILFNHGSTGRGDDKTIFRRTFAPEQLAGFFTDRGWMVVYPQRRGRGASDGIYDEGFLPDRSRYACDVQYSQPGFERALADIDAALDAVIKRDDVDATRVVIAGQSRGGILAIAYAGTRPSRVVGAINFVGGWMGEGCASAAALNGKNFERGAAFKRPTLWLYGERDDYYRISHSRQNFDRFAGSGGRGAFESFDANHGLWQSPHLWGPIADAYLRPIANGVSGR